MRTPEGDEPLPEGRVKSSGGRRFCGSVPKTKPGGSLRLPVSKKLATAAMRELKLAYLRSLTKRGARARSDLRVPRDGFPVKAEMKKSSDRNQNSKVSARKRTPAGVSPFLREG